MVDWPAIRPALAEGWNATEPDGVRRTSMDAGPSKSRLESTAVPGAETLTFKLSAADRDTLRTFYATNKAVSFNYTHPAWGAVTAKFSGPIKWTKKGVWWMASAPMEIYF